MVATAWKKDGHGVKVDGVKIKCETCPCEGADPCSYCNSGTTPKTIIIEVAGVVNGEPCMDNQEPTGCADVYNGRHSLQQTSNPCSYLLEVGNPCPGSTWGPDKISADFTENYFSVSFDAESWGSPAWFGKVLSTPANCGVAILSNGGSMSLDFHEHPSPCDFSNATCTVISVS
jgi:hypothetical protein